MKESVILKIIKHILRAVFFVMALVPLVWIIITSLKTPEEIYTFPLKYLPSKISFESYRQLFGYSNFWVYFRNSMLISLAASFFALFICMLSGYAISRIGSAKSKSKLMLFLFFTQMVPGFILMVPLYTIFSKFRLTNNMIVLMVIYTSTMIAFGSIMAKSFFDKVPIIIEEAAMLDGLNSFSILFRIVIPLSLPGIGAIFSFSFVNIWNELFLAVIFLSTESKMTIPVALNSFISKSGVSWDVMSAGLVVALLPTIIVFAMCQKYIIAGLTDGGVKE